jgi:sensor domain CHASE-containing protein
MKLRNKTLIVVGFTILVLVLILYIISNFLFISNLSDIEDQITYNDVGVVNNYIIKELSDLNTTSYKWGQLGYFTTQTPSGINDSYAQQIISGSDIDFIIVLDSKNKIIYSKSFNSSSQTFSNLSGNVIRYISTNTELTNLTDTNINPEGVLLLNNQSILISSNKIIPTNGNTGSSGTLILGKNLNSKDINKIIGNRNISLLLVPFVNPNGSPLYEEINPSFSENSPIWVNSSLNGTQGISIFRNNQGVAVVEMDVDEAHNILNNAYITLYYFIASFILVGSFLAIIILFYIDNTVLLRLKGLSDNVRKINPNTKQTRLIPVEGDDELSNLTTNINQMLMLVTARTKELEHAYESLKVSREHYLTLYNSIDEGFCTVEVLFDDKDKPIDYKILEMNPAFEKQNELNDANDKPLDDLAPDHEQCFEFYAKIALTGKSKHFVKEDKKLGKWYDVYVFKVGGPKNREVALLLNDITIFIESEKKLKEYQYSLEEKIEKRTEELTRSNSELEHFAYVASHDLREPLRMITSFLQLLEQRYADQLDEDANDFIEFAVNGAKRLDTMINDLLEYSQVKSKEREITEVNSEEILNETLINLKVPIEETNAIITHDPLPTIWEIKNY